MYAEPGGHVAKRPRVDFTASPQLHITTTSLSSSQGNGLGGVSASSGLGGHNHAQAGGQAGGAGGGILSPQYIEQQLTRKSHEPEKPNHILLFTVLNPTYPVTCDVLNTICSPIGKVLRIVIFKKNGVQAMVEFESVDAAKTAKENLHGSDIYSGKLKIEYSKRSKLNVYKNDSDTYDFTNPNLGKGFDMNGTNDYSSGTTSQQQPTKNAYKNMDLRKKISKVSKEKQSDDEDYSSPKLPLSNLPKTSRTLSPEQSKSFSLPSRTLSTSKMSLSPPPEFVDCSKD